MATRESSRRFHFIKEIASGGFGSVYLAKVMHADGFSRLAAIKLLHQRWSENAEIAQRMRDEARLLGWLRHRNIVDVIDLTTIGGRVAVIMEYLEAIDFKQAITQTIDTNEQMPPRVALEAIAFVASALDAAYNRPPYQGEKPLRVIHRDIKPSNIMVDESGTVKVLDFGVARADFDHRESHTQELQFGSVDYMPPERLFFEPETPFSDVYSLGATLFELLALEKLGKAKGRPEKHAQFLTDRLVFLRTRCDLPGLSGDAVVTLIEQMCSYGHEGRPSAADTVQRCRAFARGFEGEGLGEWAERVLPPLLKASREAPREPNPLTDSILSEDSASFKADDTYVDSMEEGGVLVKPGDPVPVSIPPTDERWDLLRQAALSEIQARVDGADASFPDKPTTVGRPDEEVEVIDELADSSLTMVATPPIGAARPAAARPAAARPAASNGAPPPGLTAVGNAFDAPSAAYLKTIRAPAGSTGAPAPAPPPAAPEPVPTVARPPAQTLPARPAAGALPSVGPAPGASAPPARGFGIGPSPTMIPDLDDEDDDHELTQAFRAPPRVEPPVDLFALDTPRAEPPRAEPPRLEPARSVFPAPAVGGADATLLGVPAGSRGAAPVSADPPRAPLVDEPPRKPAPPSVPPPVSLDRPERAAAPERVPVLHPIPEPVDLYDEPPPPKSRGWVLPVLVVLGLGGLVAIAAIVLVGGALLRGDAVAPGAAVVAPTTGAAGPSAAVQTAAATMAGAPAVTGGLTFVSAAPDTAKITVTCDGVEAIGADRVGLAATTATTCSVKVMLKDRTRLFGEVSGATLGTYTCFAGGTKDCVK